MTGSDDAAVLIEGLEGVKEAYLFIGTAEPEVFAEAQKQGIDFPFPPMNRITRSISMAFLSVPRLPRC